MASHVLISPVGFAGWKTRDVLLEMDFDHLVLLRTSHPRARRNVGSTITAAARRGISVEEIEVRPAFSYLAWFRALSASADRYRPAEITINVTSSHGVAIGMATILAAQRGLACVCYDVVTRRAFPGNPSALLQLERIGPTERLLLRALWREGRTVNELQKATGIKLSTLSMALQRLRTDAWVRSRREGKSIRYELHPGARDFAGDLLGKILVEFPPLRLKGKRIK